MSGAPSTNRCETETEAYDVQVSAYKMTHERSGSCTYAGRNCCTVDDSRRGNDARQGNGYTYA